MSKAKVKSKIPLSFLLNDKSNAAFYYLDLILKKLSLDCEKSMDHAITDVQFLLYFKPYLWFGLFFKTFDMIISLITVPTHNKHFSHDKHTFFALTKMSLFGEEEK